MFLAELKILSERRCWPRYRFPISVAAVVVVVVGSLPDHELVEPAGLFVLVGAFFRKMRTFKEQAEQSIIRCDTSTARAHAHPTHQSR